MVFNDLVKEIIDVLKKNNIKDSTYDIILKILDDFSINSEEFKEKERLLNENEKLKAGLIEFVINSQNNK